MLQGTVAHFSDSDSSDSLGAHKMTFHESLHRNRLQLILVLPLLSVLYVRIMVDMVSDWYHDDNYSHGFIVPVIAAYFLWQLWPELKGRLVKPDPLGLAVIMLGIFQLLIAWLAAEYFTMRSSLIVLLAGMTLYWFGKEVLKGMALPLGYLFFMVPVPYIIYETIAFPLKLFVTKVSVAFLKIVGVVVMRDGNIIMFPSTTLEVADACSGIRSLISLLAIAVAYAFLIRTTTSRRWIMILSAIPIAVTTNSVRVIVTGILAQWWGAKAAEGFFHEFAGLAVFMLAMVLLIAVGEFIRRLGASSHA
jgi:exosortase